MKIILGSASRSRKQLMQQAGFDFSVMHADIDEKAIRHDDPQQMVLAIAQAKAEALLPQIENEALLITCDQVVICHGEVREKPTNKQQAQDYLKSYNQYPAETITAVVVTHTRTGIQKSIIDQAQVYFKSIPEDLIKKIVADGSFAHCAGGFSIDADQLLAPYIERIEGQWDSVKGMPINLLKQLLTEINHPHAK